MMSINTFLFGLEVMRTVLVVYMNLLFPLLLLVQLAPVRPIILDSLVLRMRTPVLVSMGTAMHSVMLVRLLDGAMLSTTARMIILTVVLFTQKRNSVLRARFPSLTLRLILRPSRRLS